MGDITGLLALVVDKFSLLVAGAIFMLLRVISATPVGNVAIYRRLLPLLPEMLGAATSLVGGLPAVANQPIFVRLAAGIWCGYLAGKFHKVLGQTVLGDDSTLAAAMKPLEVKMTRGSIPPRPSQAPGRTTVPSPPPSVPPS